MCIYIYIYICIYIYIYRERERETFTTVYMLERLLEAAEAAAVLPEHVVQHSEDPLRWPGVLYYTVLCYTKLSYTII